MNGADINKITTQELKGNLFEQHDIRLTVLRADLLHSVISGNKWFKLKYNLVDAKRLGKTGIASFGGAYSNHLLAMACICHSEGLASLAVVRGEEPPEYSPTLRQLRDYNTQLHFVSREAYKDKDALRVKLNDEFPNYYWVNEGGQGENGIKGASEMLDFARPNDFTHIACAVGTGTMMKGLLRSATANQQVIGLPVLKIADPLNSDLVRYIGKDNEYKNYKLLFDYHHGGYAQKDIALIQFMNDLYRHYSVPTDFVYTGKLFKGVFSLIQANYFPRGSRLLIIHSGGLQGNRSLPPGSLIFDS